MATGDTPAPVGTTTANGDTFHHAGVTVSIPDDHEAAQLDRKLRSGVLVALAKVRPVVPVTVTAEPGIEPVAIDLHLVDATCSGHCHTDFTVVVEAATPHGMADDRTGPEGSRDRVTPSAARACGDVRGTRGLRRRATPPG